MRHVLRARLARWFWRGMGTGGRYVQGVTVAGLLNANDAQVRQSQ